mgnify:CR=1 FL=1
MYSVLRQLYLKSRKVLQNISRTAPPYFLVIISYIQMKNKGDLPESIPPSCRKNAFRQVEQKFRRHIAVSQGIFGQDDGNNAATIMRSAADGLYAA